MDYVEFDSVVVKHTTDKAVLIEFDDEEVWIPWSCVEDNDEDFKVGYKGKMYVAEWWAEKEGWA